MEYDIEHLNSEIWFRMQNCEMRACYFSHMSSRYHWFDIIVRFGLALTSSGAFTSVFFGSSNSSTSSGISIGLSLFVALLAVSNQVFSFSKRYQEYVSFHKRWAKVVGGYQVLWNNFRVNAFSLDKLNLDLNKLIQEEAALNGECARFNSKRLLRLCQQEVKKIQRAL